MVPQGNLGAFAATQTFKDVIVGATSLSGNFASVTTAAPLFSASLTPDATTPNALDATLALNPAALAASAQDLTQDARLGLDAPRVLTQAVQDRLVASGGALGEGAAVGAGQKGGRGLLLRQRQHLGARRGSVRQRDGFERRCGLRHQPRGPAHRRRRLAPRQRHRGGNRRDLRRNLGEVQGRLEHQCELVPGRRLRRLGGRAVVRLGKRRRELQRVRHLAPAHALRPSGRCDLLAFRPKLSGPCRGWLSLGRSGRRGVRHALRGARLRERASSRLQRDGRLRRAFRERGGRELLPDDARRAPHLAHRDGQRTARSFPSFASAGTTNSSTPRKRSRPSLVGVAGSGFSATGIAFGRDAALVGAGFSMELSPDAKVFVDYDGRLSSRLQEHSISGGLKVRF